MTKPVQPTHDECDAKTLRQDAEGWCEFATWHPQWGGCGGHCLVRFGTSTSCCSPEPGCFDVVNWHDGEFPIGDDSAAKPDEKHYCDAGQLIGFGLDVLEAMVKHQTYKGASVVVHQEQLERWLTRLTALRVSDE